MAITERVKQILWGKSGATCSFPECRCSLVVVPYRSSKSPWPHNPPSDPQEGLRNALLAACPHPDQAYTASALPEDVPRASEVLQDRVQLTRRLKEMGSSEGQEASLTLLCPTLKPAHRLECQDQISRPINLR
jgi:hypothetical protein